MKTSKNGFLNKIIIYKYPVFERVFVMVGSIPIAFLPLIFIIAGLYNDDMELLKVIFLQIILIFFIFVVCFFEFNTYISLDVDNDKITIRKGFEKEVLSLDGLISITVENSAKDPNTFYINYKYKYAGYSKKDFSWSVGRSSTVLFGTLQTQRRRLEKFCAKCNSLLSKGKQNV